MRPSFATRLNLDLLEENYERWQENPRSADTGWAPFCEECGLGERVARAGAAVLAAATPAEGPLQTRVDGLVYAYRTLGHTIANVNPLADARPTNPLLSLRE